jgi:hypothetical protein
MHTRRPQASTHERCPDCGGKLKPLGRPGSHPNFVCIACIRVSLPPPVDFVLPLKRLEAIGNGAA